METSLEHEKQREAFDNAIESLWENRTMSDENANAQEITDFIPSTNRLLAKRYDDSFAGTDNPATLPRFYATAPDGKRHEIIRGLDVCLKHVPGSPELGCKEKPRSRGLCPSCRQQAAYLVGKNLTTWEMLEAVHAALPSARDTKRRGEVLSMKEFLISSGAYIER